MSRSSKRRRGVEGKDLVGETMRAIEATKLVVDEYVDDSDISRILRQEEETSSRRRRRQHLKGLSSEQPIVAVLPTSFDNIEQRGHAVPIADEDNFVQIRVAGAIVSVSPQTAADLSAML